MSVMSQTCVQLELDLCTTPSFDDLLARKCISNVTVTTTRRLRRGWYAKTDRNTGGLALHVPAYLENAPENVKQDLVDWTLLTSHRKNARRRLLEQNIFTYIKAHGLETRNRSFADPALFRTKGRTYDLAEVFDFVNKAYFSGAVASYVRWGRHPLRSYQSVRIGPDGGRYNLITIAQMYDRPGVPRFAVEAIVHHEMLHIACPPQSNGARTAIHGPEFKRRERQFPRHGDWIAWEKRCLKQMSRRG
jgi:hypothetical protein